MASTFEIRDPDSQQVVGECRGPDANGACPRVDIGQVLPCAGSALSGTGPDGTPYEVPRTMTLCPVTLAQALGVELNG